MRTFQHRLLTENPDMPSHSRKLMGILKADDRYIQDIMVATFGNIIRLDHRTENWIAIDTDRIIYQIVELDKDSPYKVILEEIVLWEPLRELTKDELPSHTHSGSTSVDPLTHNIQMLRDMWAKEEIPIVWGNKISEEQQRYIEGSLYNIYTTGEAMPHVEMEQVLEEFNNQAEQEETAMNIKKKAAVLIPDLCTVAVVFPEHDGSFQEYAKHYSYKTTWNYEIGDLVLVPVHHGDKMHIKVAKVVKKHTVPDVEKAGKWIIGKVDMTYYDKMVKVDEEIQERLQRLEFESFRSQAAEALAEDLGCSTLDVQKQVTEAIEHVDTEEEQ